MQVQYTVLTTISANSEHYVIYSFEQNRQTLQRSLKLLSLAFKVTVRGQYFGLGRRLGDLSNFLSCCYYKVAHPFSAAV